MQESSPVRALSLVFALCVLIGGWLLFEYSQQQYPVAATAGDTDPNALPATAQESRPFPNQTSANPGSGQGNLSITYKCASNGRISYSDKPCAAREQTIAVTTEEKAPGSKNNLEQIRERAAAWNASRVDREKPSALIDTTASSRVSPQNNELRCRQIDIEIANIDALLRQAHSAQSGDDLAGQRRNKYDERFSLGC